jgi:hypothetical protein
VTVVTKLFVASKVHIISGDGGDSGDGGVSVDADGCVIRRSA